jgi:RNA polymerase sigma-B factor
MLRRPSPVRGSGANGRPARDEERALALRYAREGDAAAREQLLAQLLPLARRLARRFCISGEPLEDLTQVAMIGAVKAVDRFDPERGTPLASYAAPLLTGELKHHLRDNTGYPRVPEALHSLAFRAARAVSEASARLGRRPQATEIAAALQISPAEAVEALRVAVARERVSLESMVLDEASQSSRALAREDERYLRIEDLDLVRDAVRRLPGNERLALYLTIVRDLTYREAARRMGVSPRHASRLTGRALSRLRQLVGADESNPDDDS